MGQRRWRRGARCALLGLLGAALMPAGPAPAHIEFGARTLSLLVAGAEVVAPARILAVDAESALPASGTGRPTVRAELTAVWKGSVEPGELRFAQHGHGTALYEPGEEVLLFLLPIARSRELASLASAGIAWVSLQEHDEKFSLSEASAPLLETAVRAYHGLGALSDPAARLEEQRRITRLLLGSGDRRLAASALQDLVMAEDLPLVTEADLPVLLPLVDEAGLSIGQRLALLVELERRGLVADPDRWVRLLDETGARDRRAVIRAAGRHPAPRVAEALRSILTGSDASAAREAAIALGQPGRGESVAPLAAALAEGDRSMRRAAIRGLGRIGTPDALRALEEVALRHPDPETRRRARAEVRVGTRTADSGG